MKSKYKYLLCFAMFAVIGAFMASEAFAQCRGGRCGGRVRSLNNVNVVAANAAVVSVNQQQRGLFGRRSNTNVTVVAGQPVNTFAAVSHVPVAATTVNFAQAGFTSFGTRTIASNGLFFEQNAFGQVVPVGAVNPVIVQQPVFVQQPAFVQVSRRGRCR